MTKAENIKKEKANLSKGSQKTSKPRSKDGSTVSVKFETDAFGNPKDSSGWSLSPVLQRYGHAIVDSLQNSKVGNEDRKKQSESRQKVKLTITLEIRADMYEAYERLGKQLVRPGEEPVSVETLIARGIQHWLRNEYEWEPWPREPSPNELRIIESGACCGT